METPADTIDVTMGVHAPGNTLIGPYRPFALVRPGPDCLDSGSTGGYRKAQPIRYFSQLHVSGTGGGGRYGHIGLMPYIGERAFAESPANPKEERAEVGRYRVELDTGVFVSLAATDRCAHYQIRRAHGNEDLRIW